MTEEKDPSRELAIEIFKFLAPKAELKEIIAITEADI